MLPHPGPSGAAVGTQLPGRARSPPPLGTRRHSQSDLGQHTAGDVEHLGGELGPEVRALRVVGGHLAGRDDVEGRRRLGGVEADVQEPVRAGVDVLDRSTGGVGEQRGQVVHQRLVDGAAGLERRVGAEGLHRDTEFLAQRLGADRRGGQQGELRLHGRRRSLLVSGEGAVDVPDRAIRFVTPESRAYSSARLLGNPSHWSTSK